MASSVSTRSYLIAGMAAISAGAIAIAPMHPVTQDLAIAPEKVASLAVGLASSIDPITPWINTFQTAADNVVGLFNAWAAEPFPIITQIITNQLAYLSILPDIPAIISQVISNISSAIQAPFQPDTNTLDPAHQGLYTLLPAVAPDFPQEVLDLLTTSTLGIVGGVLGPVLAPVLAFVGSVQNIIGDLGSSDFIGALNELINIPANLVNAFLNGGQTLDLTGLLAPLIPNPPATLNSAGLVLGGILAQGASLFNALAVDVSVRLAPPPVPPITVDVPGNPGGVIGAVIAFTKAIASAIEVVPPPAAAVAKVAAAEVVAPEAEAELPAAPVDVPDAVAFEASEASEPIALSATADTESDDGAVTSEAPEVTATTVDSVKRGGGSGDGSANQRSGRAKPARSGESNTAGQDAPKCAAGKAGASRG